MKGTKGGHGFNLVPLLDDRGVPLAHVVDRIQENETRIAVPVIEQWGREVRPHYPADRLRVMSADGGFNSPHVRIACRAAGMIENLHPVSHSDKPESRANAERYDAMRFRIHGTTDWQLNGHREIVAADCCESPAPTLARTAWLGKLGKAFTRIKATCSNCGSTVTVTSGRRRREQNPDRMVPKHYRDRDLDTDLSAGNPLTYNDPMSYAFGKARWSRGEGWNGALANRYKLNAKRRRFRSKTQVELETNIVFSIMTSLAIAGRQHEAAAPPVEVAA